MSHIENQEPFRIMPHIEKHAPFFLAVVVAVLLIYKMEYVQQNSSYGTINFVNLYAAMFDWSAIQTGFLFAIFGYVAGKSDGFIEAVRHTTPMKAFLGYQRTAIALGFAITFISIPLMVISHKIHSSNFSYYVFCGWAFISVWGFFAFMRVAYLFGLLVRPKEPKRKIG